MYHPRAKMESFIVVYIICLVVFMVLALPCHALPRDDPEVDSEHHYSIGYNDFAYCRAYKTYIGDDTKKYAVILAYLHLVHRIPAGYGVFKPKMSTLLACALEFLSLTWLKKRLSDMGLFRRGNKVQYTPLRLVNAAIQVCDR